MHPVFDFLIGFAKQLLGNDIFVDGIIDGVLERIVFVEFIVGGNDDLGDFLVLGGLAFVLAVVDVVLFDKIDVLFLELDGVDSEIFVEA